MENTKTVSGGKLVKRYMKEYGTYVVEERAVADYRDGLKPVQRRLLYAMYDRGYFHNKNFHKAADIIGNTMACFHPHGDCLRGNTLIYSLDGKVRTIEEIYNEGIENLWVLGYDENKKVVVPVKAHDFRIGQKTNKIYKIKFVGGGKIEVTDNHPLFSIMRNSWIKAKDINPGETLLSGKLINGHYSVISSNNPDYHFNNQVHRIVGEYFYDEKEIFHHRDENTKNNNPKNIKPLSREKHAYMHGNYTTGLENGREEMFSENGKYRKAIRKKNSLLMSEYNSKLYLIKAVKIVMQIMQDGKEPTENLYEKYRGNIYNGTTLKKVYDNGNTFNELIGYAKSGGFKLDTSKSIGLTEKIHNKFKVENKPHKIDPAIDGGVLSSCSIVVLKCIKKYGIHFTIKEYEKTRKRMCANTESVDIHKRKFPKFTTLHDRFGFSSIDELLKGLYPNYLLVVEDVDIIDVDNEPMYDFTVNKYANMFIPFRKNSKGDMALVLVHNSSLHGALVTLVNQRMPMVEGHGNWDAWEPGAARYIECRLQKLAKWIFDCNEVGQFVPNYNDERQEPLVLPSRLPLLLMNGTEGIGVGIACCIPPFNVSELLDTIIRVIRDKDITTKKIAKYLKAPDYGTGVVLSSPDEILTIYKNGKGTINYGSRYEIRESKSGDDVHELVIKSPAPRLNVDRSIKSKKGSDGETINKRLSLKQTCDKMQQDKLIEYSYFGKGNELIIGYKNSSILKRNILPLLETSISYDFHVEKRIKQGEATVYHTNIKSLLFDWVDYRREVEKKYLKLMASKVEQKIAREDALLIAIKNIIIIADALKKDNTEEIIKKKLKLTDFQVDVIMKTPLGSLKKKNEGDIKSRIKEFYSELKTINYNIKNLDDFIVDILKQIKKDAGDIPRGTLLETKKVTIKGTDEGGLYVIAQDRNLRKLHRVTGAFKFNVVSKTADGVTSVSDHGIAGNWDLMDISKGNVDNKFAPIVGLVPYTKNKLIALTNHGNLGVIENNQDRDGYQVMKLKGDEYVMKALGMDENDKLIVWNKNKIHVWKFDELITKRPGVYGKRAVPNTSKPATNMYVIREGDSIIQSGVKVKVKELKSGKEFYIVSNENYINKKVKSLKEVSRLLKKNKKVEMFKQII